MKQYLEKSMSYTEYKVLIDRLISEGATTGPSQSVKLAEFTKLNRQRMRRIERTLVLTPSLVEAAQKAVRNRIWLIITEAWCGDAAQSIPVIEAIAGFAPGVRTRYVLRDENPALMDKFLTNGGRSIPKLICLDTETLEVLGTWGPRPAVVESEFLEMKKRGFEKPVMMEEIQRWYSRDRQTSIQTEFEEFLRGCGSGVRAGM